MFPEANENFEIYFSTPEGKSSFIYGLPMSYLLAFLSYSLILYLEKVVFNSQALIAHTHNHLDNGIVENDLNEPLLEKNKMVKCIMIVHIIYMKMIQIQKIIVMKK